MDYNKLKILKSGSDIRGIASRLTTNITLTDEAVYCIIRAFCIWYRQKYSQNACSVAVGHDVRISADRILKQVIRALTDEGINAVDCGLCSTPSMFMLLKSSFGCDASVMITASHLPADRNGLKFFTPDGGLDGDDIDKIIEIAALENFDKIAKERGAVNSRTFLTDYCAMLVSKVRSACGEQTPLADKKIIVDAGNGAGGFFCNMVLQPLGADTNGSIFLEPDGTFPNHIPNPENKQAMAYLKEAVLREHADLGIIFDTDVDRAGAVDSDGLEINRNRLIALAATMVLDCRGGTIVTDSVTSSGLTKFIEEHGGRHLRFKRGYKNVIDEAVRRNQAGEYCPLAIETSGHAAFADNYFLDDGAYLVTRILICLAKQTKKKQKLGELIKDLESPIEENEIRVCFKGKAENFGEEAEKIIEDVRQKSVHNNLDVATDNYEGVKVSFGKGDGNGWFLLRMSVHDPVMPINFESNLPGGNRIIASKLFEMLKDYPSLDTSNLLKFIQNT